MQFLESAVIEKTSSFTDLTIGEGVKLTAPAGKIVTLTIDGIQKNIVPGSYTGDIVLTVSDAIPRKAMMGGDRPFGAALVARNGDLVSDSSIPAMIRGGKVEPGLIEGVEINALGDVVGGIDLSDGDWTIRDSTLSLSGYGDCNGKGTGIYIGGEDTNVEIENISLDSAGVARSAIIVTDGARAVIRNSRIRTFDGDKAQEAAAAADVGGMVGVPWQLGLSGNCRTTQVLEHGSAEYIDSTIETQGWGVLSVDAVTSPKSWEEYSIHLSARNCKVRVTGPSGYGAFTTGACLDVFEDTDFQVGDYGLIQANETASATYRNCTVESGRFGVMSYCNQGGTLKIEDSRFHTEKAMFLVKGCYPQIEVERSELNTENGIVLQLMDMDDSFYGGTENFDDNVAQKDPEHDVTKVNFRDFKIFGNVDAVQKPTDVQATFRDMTLKGDFYNGITNAAGITYLAMDAPEFGEMSGGPGGPEGFPGGPGGGFPGGDMSGGPGGSFPGGDMPGGFPGGGFPGGDMPGGPGGGFPGGGMPGSFPGGGFPSGDMPGGPGGGFPGGDMPGGPGGGFPGGDMPGGFSGGPPFELSYSTRSPINLAVRFEGVDYTGTISATTARHAVKECCKENYRHMGVVTNQISPVVNNGVIVSIDGKSRWTVTGKGYISALHIDPGAKIAGAEGKTVKMTVDGVETAVAAGDYKGAIVIELI